MYGSVYVIDHCNTERDRESERTNLEYYVTDVLHLIGVNVASIAHGKYISSSWRDIHTENTKKYEEKTGDEIAEDVVKKAGLVYGGDS